MPAGTLERPLAERAAAHRRRQLAGTGTGAGVGATAEIRAEGLAGRAFLAKACLAVVFACCLTFCCVDCFAFLRFAFGFLAECVGAFLGLAVVLAILAVF